MGVYGDDRDENCHMGWRRGIANIPPSPGMGGEAWLIYDLRMGWERGMVNI